MGSKIEINDTLQITTEQGFPEDIINLERHRKGEIKLKDLESRVFNFNKPGARYFHHYPTRCFLAHNIDGRWLFWGEIEILSQTIVTNPKQGELYKEKKPETTTVGKYRIIKIYNLAYMLAKTKHELPPEKQCLDYPYLSII